MGEETKRDDPSLSRDKGGKESGSNWSEESEKKAVRYLFTLGEVAQVSLVIHVYCTIALLDSGLGHEGSPL